MPPEEQKKLFSSDVANRNEANAYKIIVCELKKWSTDGKLPVPDCLYADENCIVLQDLSADYGPVDKFSGGYSFQQCTKILEVRKPIRALLQGKSDVRFF